MGSLLAGITVTLSLQVRKLFSWQVSLSLLLVSSAHRQDRAAKRKVKLGSAKITFVSPSGIFIS